MAKNIIFTIGLNTGGAELMLLKLLEKMSQNERQKYLVISLMDIGTIGSKILELNVSVKTMQINTLLGFLLFHQKKITAKLLVYINPCHYQIKTY